MSVNIYNPTTGDLTTVADSIDSLEKVSALPSVTTDLIGKIYLLTDEQTGYKKGGIYECQAVEITPIGTENPSEEGWYELSGADYVLSADTTVASGKTYYTIEWVLISSSGDTNIFNGTLAEWEALSSEDKANYSHIATPEEVDITGSYSTTETKTGAIWIDGKPIYRRVLQHNGATIGTEWATVFSNQDWVTNVDMCIYGKVVGYYDSAKTQKRVGNFIDIRLSGTSIQTYAASNSAFSGGYYLILEYTKTTDN